MCRQPFQLRKAEDRASKPFIDDVRFDLVYDGVVHRHRPPSLQGVIYLVPQMPGVVIATQLAQRRLVQLSQDLAEQRRIGIPGRKALAVDLAQGADQRVAVLLADPAILVPMAAIQARFLHVSLPGGVSSAWRERAPKGVDWQWRARRFSVGPCRRESVAVVRPSPVRMMKSGGYAACSSKEV